MIKWELLLGADVLYEFNHQYGPFEEGAQRNTELRQIIRQHKIVLSTCLRDYYENYFFENWTDDYESIVELFDDEPSFADSPFVFVKSSTNDNNDFLKAAEEIIKQREKTILICDNQEQYNSLKSTVNEQKMMKAAKFLEASIGNKVYRNSVVFSKDLFPEDIDNFSAWLREAFAGEKNVEIVDPYLGKHKNMLSFLEHYINRFEKGSIIKIYTYIDMNEDMITGALWRRFIQQTHERQLTVFVYNVSRKDKIDDIHDRRIYLNTSQTHITIGHGLDTFRTINELGEEKEKIADCHLTIDKDMTKIRQIRKYEKNEYNYKALCTG